jgi:hypothetical protein
MIKSINSSIVRVGNFTSSEIVALTKEGPAKGTLGKPALTYIEECNIERRLLRSISDEVNARSLVWGKLVEPKAFELLGLEYSLNSNETITHPHISYWVGSPDCFKEDEGRTVVDIKSPMTLKSFCIFYDCREIQEVRAKHKDGEKYYWQLVSNAVISNCKYAELIIYMPYKYELQDIRELASSAPDDEIYKYFWIINGNDEELPHLLENSYYKNLKIIRFKVPDEDKEFLTERVLMSGAKLKPYYKPKGILKD